MEHYKELMITCGLYVLAMSEVRRDGSGGEDVGDGFVFIWQGNGDDGSKGGIGFLLSPEAAKVLRKGSSVSKSSDTGRTLALSVALGGGEGTWTIMSVYGPTSQGNADEKCHDKDRQNDYMNMDGNSMNGNWESGVSFIDQIRLGTPSNTIAPDQGEISLATFQAGYPLGYVYVDRTTSCARAI